MGDYDKTTQVSLDIPEKGTTLLTDRIDKHIWNIFNSIQLLLLNGVVFSLLHTKSCQFIQHYCLNGSCIIVLSHEIANQMENVIKNDT